VQKKNVCIIGSGTDGTACALRLFRAGFGIMIIEKSPPVDIYHHLTFSRAYFSGKRSIDGITARTLPGAIEAGLEPDIQIKDFVDFQIKNREIALLTHEQVLFLKNIQIDYLVLTDSQVLADDIIHISNNTKLICIGFNENVADCRYRIANDPVHFGQVLYPFLDDKAFSSKEINGTSESDNIIKAPLEGVFTTLKQVGDNIYEKDEAGRINDIPILSPFAGRITGLLNSGLFIQSKTIFAEVNPVKNIISTSVLPQSSFALAGGVLEAVIFDSLLDQQND
jgi:xanthine dehydrogenase accessory factor